MNISQAGVDQIKAFEGCRLKAYQDGGGVWTIGYGHIVGVRKGDVITQQHADEMAAREIGEFAAKVAAMIKVPVTQNQFDAMTSLAYNIGTEAFRESTLLRRLNAGIQGVEDQFLRWNRDNGKPNAGLTKRRAKERALFLTP